MEERLQKLIAQAGITSRRTAETLIQEGRVMVNGKTAHLGDKADPTSDDIRVDGSRLRIENTRLYIMLNKPKGVVTAVSPQEQETRRTVRDLLPLDEYLYPVGRLDADSEGLVLMTNDGELAQKLSHPRYEHPKVYEVTLVGDVPAEKFDTWSRGIVLDDGPTQPVEIRVLRREKGLTTIRVTMREGRKRQIRRTANTLGCQVVRLIRTNLDRLSLGTLGVGEWRYLTPEEIAALQDSASSTQRAGKPMPANKRPPRPAAESAAPDKSRAGHPERSSHSGKPRRPVSSPTRRRGVGGGAARRPSASGRPGSAGRSRSSGGGRGTTHRSTTRSTTRTPRRHDTD